MRSFKASGGLLAASTLIALLGAYGTLTGSPEEEGATPIEGFPDASLTIFPLTVFWTGEWEKDEAHRAFANAYQRGFRGEKARPFALTLGLLLEEKGYAKYEVAEADFQLPREEGARKTRAATFGEFVRELDLKTDYALCTELIHTGQRGGMYEEVYSAIVNAKGQVAWEDTQRRRGSDTELGALELACSRLAPAMALDKLPKRELAEEKKRMLREVRAKEPPSESERKAMEERLNTLKEAGASARVLVYPARVGGNRTDPTCAKRLSKLLNEAGLCQATAAETGPVIEGSGWPNEMQVLWLFARNVREYVREHPADSDYALFPDYWFAPSGKVWAVHSVVCDRTGDWVIVDLQNSHQETFQQIDPRNLEDCDRLVLARSRLLGGGETAGTAEKAPPAAVETVDSRAAASKQRPVPDDLVMTAKDMPMEVGRRLTYALASPAGDPIGEFEIAFVGTRTVGNTKLCRQAARFGAMRVGDQWLSVGDDGFVVTDSFGAALPGNKYPLPLKVGMAFEYESTRGKVSAKVVGTEAVEVPAGTFACLAVAREREADGRKRIEKHWIAPGVGIVKFSEEDTVVTLARVEAPHEPKPEKGAVALSTFDTPDPLRSPLLPRAVWITLAGEVGQSSALEIDPFIGGADDTPFCLRWTYAKSGTWASALLSLGGDGQPPVDLSRYKGVSFYVKGLFEQPCTVTIHANAAHVSRRATVPMPVQVTKEWQKVVLTPDTHPPMGVIDPRQSYALSFDVQEDDGTANVIWIDEVKLLLDE